MEYNYQITLKPVGQLINSTVETLCFPSNDKQTAFCGFKYSPINDVQNVMFNSYS